MATLKILLKKMILRAMKQWVMWQCELKMNPQAMSETHPPRAESKAEQFVRSSAQASSRTQFAWSNAQASSRTLCHEEHEHCGSG